MTSMTPYRLQIFLPNEVREALRDVAHKERISLQRLVLTWLVEKLQSYPEGVLLPRDAEER